MISRIEREGNLIISIQGKQFSPHYLKKRKIFHLFSSETRPAALGAYIATKTSVLYVTGSENGG